MTIRKAIAADSNALIALTASSPMEGRLSLRIDRKPDFFSLLHERGDHIVMVAEDSNGAIIGSFSAARQSFVINEELQPVYYLGDLKVDAAYRQSSVAYRLVKAMQAEIVYHGVHLFLCTAAEGNQPVFSFFEGRTGFPPFHQTSVFSVFQLLPRKAPFDQNIAADSSKHVLKEFYESYFRRYRLHPPIDHLENCTSFSYLQNGNIVAAISLFDPIALKQNVIVDFPFSISLSLALIRTLKYFFPLPSIPAKGSTLKLIYVRYAAFKTGCEKQFISVLRQARHFAAEHHYHFVTMAVDEKDKEMHRMVATASRFTFRSYQLVATLDKNDELVNQITNDISYEDYSLI